MTRRRETAVAFVSPAVDFALVGGASLAAYLVLLALGSSVSGAAVTGLLNASLAFAVNGMHFSATDYRLYRSRDTIGQYPLTAWATPALVGAGALAALARPASVAPYFLKLYLLWSPYHYSGQSVGLSLLYARRAGVHYTPLERRTLSAFVFGTFAAAAIYGETGFKAYDVAGAQMRPLGLPLWLHWAALAWVGAAFLALAALAVARRRREGALPHWLVAVPALTQFLWFVPGLRLPNFFLLIPFFHGLQYLLVAWFLQLQERAHETRPAPGFVARETGLWLAWNVAGFLFLFLALPKLAGRLWGGPPLLAATIVVAAVQLHHFFVDGVIWRLRNPKVAAPLEGSLSGLLRPEPA